MKQTAVEWLYELSKERELDKFDLEQAKAMHKEQMSRIYEGLLQNVGTSIKQSDLPTFEEYYNHTFKK
jgi:hypothetical protein